MRLVLLGPPGAGKGSLAKALKDLWKILHVSTGDLLREEIKKASKLGLEAKGYIEKGALVPDELVTRLVEQYLHHEPAVKKGFMLDGFPRTEQQARDLDRILADIKLPLEYALDMDATLSVILPRLTGRRVCRKCGALFHMINKPPRKQGICDECGGELYQRSDDKEETIRARMDIYHKTTKPIVEYYKKQGILRRVSGDRETDDLKDSIMAVLNENR